ncbi:MAG: ATP-dependent DNA helicase [Micrococcaceae bacterium]
MSIKAPHFIKTTRQKQKIKLTRQQQELVAVPKGPTIQLVKGMAGTGKTTVIKERAIELGKSELVEESIVLVPTRVRGVSLRNKLAESTHVDISLPMVKTWQAVAFEVLKTAHVQKITESTVVKTKLITGPEQDDILAQILQTFSQDDNFAAINWPEGYEEAIVTKTFRDKVRRFFDRCIEHGVNPEKLVEYAKLNENKKQLWQALAQVYKEYLERLATDDKYAGAYTPSQLLRAAVEILKLDQEFRYEMQNRYRHILIDDAHDINSASLELLGLLVTKDTTLLACFNPDVTVEGFRGADPNNFRLYQDLFADKLGLPFEEEILNAAFRFSGEIESVNSKLSDKLPAKDSGERRSGVEFLAKDSGKVKTKVFSSEIAEEYYLTEQLTKLHVKQDVPWSNCAVIVRGYRELNRFKRTLSRADIPLELPSAEVPLKDEAAVWPLLDIFLLAQKATELSKEKTELSKKDIEELSELFQKFLKNVYLNASEVDIRRIKTQLRKKARENMDYSSSDVLLVKALTDPSLFDLDIHKTKKDAEKLSGCKKKLAKFYVMLDAAQKARNAIELSVNGALWEVWEASDKADTWKYEALSGGEDSGVADHYLDSVVALFSIAQRYSANRGSRIDDFISYMNSQEIPEDSIAKRSMSKDLGVVLLTPAGAMGREFDYVFLPALQEGSWPATMLAQDLLGQDELVSTVTGNALLSYKEKRDDTYRDELRLFLAALSRGKKLVSLTAVSTEEHQVSSLLFQVSGILKQETEVEKIKVPKPFNAKTMVIELRQVLEDPDTSEKAQTRKTEAVRLLTELAKRNIPGANPAQWWGYLGISSNKPFYAETDEIRVSPSKIEQIHDCPLCWLVDRVGGSASSDDKRNLGNLAHAIAQDINEPEEAVTSKLEELRTELKLQLNNRWHELGRTESWAEKKELERAEKMMDFHVDYVKQMMKEQRKLLRREEPFEAKIADKVILHGKVDRLERDPDGKLVVVDLKTGQNAPSKADIEEHQQLLGYQLAVEKSGFKEKLGSKTGGAAIAQIGSKNVKLPRVFQEPLSDDKKAEFTSRVIEAAKLMRGPNFIARHDLNANNYSRSYPCNVPEVCPLCLGKQVTEL